MTACRDRFLLETWSLQLSHEELKDVLQEAADNLNLDQKWKKTKKKGMDNE